MKIDIGSYVRIAGNFPLNRNLQNPTGTIESLPNKEHRQEYLIEDIIVRRRQL